MPYICPKRFSHTFVVSPIAMVDVCSCLTNLSHALSSNQFPRKEHIALFLPTFLLLYIESFFGLYLNYRLEYCKDNCYCRIIYLSGAIKTFK